MSIIYDELLQCQFPLYSISTYCNFVKIQNEELYFRIAILYIFLLSTAKCSEKNDHKVVPNKLPSLDLFFVCGNHGCLRKSWVIGCVEILYDCALIVLIHVSFLDISFLNQWELLRDSCLYMIAYSPHIMYIEYVFSLSKLVSRARLKTLVLFFSGRNTIVFVLLPPSMLLSSSPTVTRALPSCPETSDLLSSKYFRPKHPPRAVTHHHAPPDSKPLSGACGPRAAFDPSVFDVICSSSLGFLS